MSGIPNRARKPGGPSTGEIVETMKKSAFVDVFLPPLRNANVVVGECIVNANHEKLKRAVELLKKKDSELEAIL